ncbi:SpoIIE family protein phosphatase [candidate division KSB1 bacterium]|nr:SpoIIE family protein phosphatase [candidate division KSB1 bacterium]
MAIAVLGLGLFVFVFIFYAREATKVQSWRRSGTTLSEVRNGNGPRPVFAVVDSTDFAAAPYPSWGDTVVTIGDSVATPDRWARYFGSPGRAGERTEISWRTARGDTLRNVVIEQLPQTHQLRDMIILQVLRFLVSFLFVGVGLWAFFARPQAADVRVFTLFCLSMAAFMIAGVNALGKAFAAFDIIYLNTIIAVLSTLGSLFAPFWLHLNLVFPRPLKFIERRPWLTYVICYSISAAILIWNGLFVDGQQGRTVINVFFGALAVEIAVGFLILVYRKKRATDILERRQANLVSWGAGVSLGLLLVLVLAVNLFSVWFQRHPQLTILAINFAFLGMLSAPLSFAYAFGRWRLLDVEARIRRGTRYLLITGLAFVVLSLLAMGLGYLVGTNFTPRNQIVVVAVAIALTAPLQRRLRNRIERRVYPERERLRQLIRDFLQRALLLSDKESFWTQLEERLRAGLLVETVYPVVLSGEDGRFIGFRGALTPFCLGTDFVLALERESRPVLIDEVIASSRVRMRADESSWLTQHGVALVLPLVAQQRLVGFLGLGRKLEREDFSAEELRILDSLAPQIALASENMRLIEENVEKQRLEEQMKIARQIQQGLLPHDLPDTPGLEIATCSHFSLDVAGDYFDVIPLANGETVLSVGDVSGKGAGAALLMANLQASLRTAIDIGVPLTKTVSRVNELILRNTPPEQYITFFVGIYEPRGQVFTYVNAGHNAPILIRASGETHALDTGGLILGCVEGVVYEQESVRLEDGDVIVLYTDGVSEAMNPDEEEFGEQRILDHVVQNRHRGPRELVRGLESDVVRFHGQDQFDDDFTLMIVRGMKGTARLAGRSVDGTDQA